MEVQNCFRVSFTASILRNNKQCTFYVIMVEGDVFEKTALDNFLENLKRIFLKRVELSKFCNSQVFCLWFSYYASTYFQYKLLLKVALSKKKLQLISFWKTLQLRPFSKQILKIAWRYKIVLGYFFSQLKFCRR